MTRDQVLKEIRAEVKDNKQLSRLLQWLVVNAPDAFERYVNWRMNVAPDALGDMHGGV